MTTHQEIRIIDQLNRTVIAMLSLTGMLLDGVELADLVLQAAVILWLWMRELLESGEFVIWACHLAP